MLALLPWHCSADVRTTQVASDTTGCLSCVGHSDQRGSTETHAKLACPALVTLISMA